MVTSWHAYWIIEGDRELLWGFLEVFALRSCASYNFILTIGQSEKFED